MNAELESVESKIGYNFRNPHLICRALTHKSRAFEESARGGAATADNEQLEFLGDAVLGFIVSEILVEDFPHLPEGRLSKLKAQLVSADKLHEVALALGLGEHLLLGRGEEMNGGRTKRALLANSVEAIIAAIYLDSGYHAARRFIAESIVGDVKDLAAEVENCKDFKGALQELAQEMKLPTPKYRVVTTSGPDHSKTFVVEVALGEEHTAQAEGSSKKTAGQHAAAELLKALGGTLGPSTGTPRE